MLISLLELKREPLEFDEKIPDGVIDFGSQIRQIGAISANGRADLVEEHRGGRDVVDDIRLRAEFSGNFELPCARCLEPVEQKLSDRLDLIFRPTGADAGSPDHSISTSDTEIGYYQGDGLVLEDVLREQVLLSLPARILCRQDCKGLCPGCGSNLNQETCNCQASPPDPRWSELAGLRSRLKE
jgi:uncharacterized protein